MVKKPDKIFCIYINDLNYLAMRHLCRYILVSHFAKIDHDILQGQIDMDWNEINFPKNIAMPHDKKTYTFLIK